jgi:hypothetical protein
MVSAFLVQIDGHPQVRLQERLHAFLNPRQINHTPSAFNLYLEGPITDRSTVQRQGDQSNTCISHLHLIFDIFDGGVPRPIKNPNTHSSSSSRFYLSTHVSYDYLYVYIK